MRLAAVLGALLALVVLTGCVVHDINLRNAETHASAGYAAQSRGDWEAAARQFAQAVVNADLGRGPPRGRATVNYEYGRAMGVLCRFDDAEKYLLRSKAFDAEAGHTPFLAVYELAALNLAQGKTTQAVAYFGELMPLIEQGGVVRTAPLGVAKAHEQFADALVAVGRGGEATSHREAARSIKAANPDARPLGEGTPYGTRCVKAS